MRLPPRGTKELRAIFARYKRGVATKGWFGRTKRIGQVPKAGAANMTSTYLLRKGWADAHKIIHGINKSRGFRKPIHRSEFTQLMEARTWRHVADRWTKKIKQMRGSGSKLKALNKLSEARKNAGISRS